MKNKCHNCKGKGFIITKNNKFKAVCYYCRGTGYRYRKYKRTKIE